MRRSKISQTRPSPYLGPEKSNTHDVTHERNMRPNLAPGLSLCVVPDAGPERMVRSAALTAWGLNDKRKGAYLHMHRATWEL